MWLPLSAGAKMHLAANRRYKVIAETGGDTNLAVRTPSDTMTFRSQFGETVDYYFFYGPEPSQVVAGYRELTGAAPLLPGGRMASGNVANAIQASSRFSTQQRNFGKGRFPWTSSSRTGSTGASTAGIPCALTKPRIQIRQK